MLIRILLGVYLGTHPKVSLGIISRMPSEILAEFHPGNLTSILLFFFGSSTGGLCIPV